MGRTLEISADRMICFFPAFCDTFLSFGLPVNMIQISLLLISFLVVVSSTSTFAGTSSGVDAALLQTLETDLSPLCEACQSVDRLNSAIRDNTLAKSLAREKLLRAISSVRQEYYRAGGADFERSRWVFPLEGYGPRAIGGGRRHGFAARGYDFYSGNRHGGHPSYDIFIRDRNQDSLDDRTGRPVAVVSMTGGVVVALERHWEEGSKLRGGKYLWVYDPANELLVYYAHNGELSVELGTIVRPGDKLGTVGRSGWNAAKKRSPTHLHLTVLKVKPDGSLVPLQVYRELKKALLT